MVIFHSYVKLPEGNSYIQAEEKWWFPTVETKMWAPRQGFMHPTGALCPCSTSWSCFSLTARWVFGGSAEQRTERLVKIWWGLLDNMKK